MRRTIFHGLPIALVVGLTLVGFHTFVSSRAEAQPSQRSLVLVFSGQSTGEFRDIGGVRMDCFDVDVVDPQSGSVIGTGSDCLDLATITPIGDDGGFTLLNRQFFHLPGGHLVTELTTTTIQPVGAGSPGVTHVTGFVPAAGTNQILGGTGRFRNASGRVRLNGDVDMSLFDSDNIITFDCIFRVDFD